MAMSKALAKPFARKPSKAKPVSEYASKASPMKAGPRNGATNRLRRKK
jgi:hypothetical protein